MNSLEKVLENVQKASEAYSKDHSVKIVGISKYVGTEDVKRLYSFGQKIFGENRVQDLESKKKELQDLEIEWHFVGNLQKNKINKLIEQEPVLVHSISSFALAQELDKRLAVKGKRQRCLLQVNSADEDTKSGVSEEEAKDVYLQIQAECKNIDLEGIMSIGANTPDDEREIAKSFEVSQKIFENLKPNGAKILSMGMSGDYELAISFGANIVRLGSILFK